MEPRRRRRIRRRVGDSRHHFLLLLLALMFVVTSQAFFLPPPRQLHAVRTSLLPMTMSSSSSSDNDGDDNPFTIRQLQPNQIRLVRVIGEQRLTIEEETEARDGAGPRGAFGRIRNKKKTGQQTSKETRNLGVGARLFEAVNAKTGERLILKEFLPMMKNVAMAEVELYRYLHQWTQNTHPDWLPQDLPVIPLFGYLQTGIEVEDPAFVYDWAERFGPNSAPPRAGNTWVALRTPGILTLAALPRLALSMPGGAGKGMLDVFFPDAPWQKRLVYLKAVMAAAIDALALLHQAGVCHGSVSPSTLLVSTAEINRPDQVVVWLSDLGFAKNALTQQQLDFTGLVKRDWRLCAYTLLELFLRLLADEDAEEELPDEEEDLAMAARYEEGFALPFAQIEAARLQAVTEQRFNNDVSVGLRSLVSNEKAYARAVKFLDADGGAGWCLFQDMANTERLLQQQQQQQHEGGGEGQGVYLLGEKLLSSPFFND